MECLQFLPGPEAPPLCQFIALLHKIAAWETANALWLVMVLGILLLLLVLWRKRAAALLLVNATSSIPQERTESLLRDSVTPQQYQQILDVGYLELPSRLYANRYYRIPRGRRRVQVYEVGETHLGLRHRRLGELCVIPCAIMPDADLFLTHKWLIEADEQEYLDTANWIR